jgi:hypothetical protein
MGQSLITDNNFVERNTGRSNLEYSGVGELTNGFIEQVITRRVLVCSKRSERILVQAIF